MIASNLLAILRQQFSIEFRSGTQATNEISVFIGPCFSTEAKQE